MIDDTAIDRISSKQDLVQFIHELMHDYDTHGDEWENPTLDRFLEAMAAWLESFENQYRNLDLPIPKTPSWKFVGQMLYSATAYE